jgi:hypothetical protein
MTQRNTFKFTESKSTTGLVDLLTDLASDEDRSLNKYVGRVLWDHVASIKKEKKDNKD